MSYADIVSRIWSLATTIRETAPLVHNFSNLVEQNDTADAIAAVGGTQITLHNVEETADVAALCSAIAVNLGTLDDGFLQCARMAVQVAEASGRPWVLDPVAAGLTAYRTRAALAFLDLSPAVLKANASELLVLAGGAERGRGADSIHEVDDAEAAAKGLARRHGAVVVVTGVEDMITDGERIVRLGNGSQLMGRMIGSGCMLTSVMGCFLAVSDNPFDAALAATACFDVSGEMAAEQAGGPGTLKPLLIDALHGLDRATVEDRLKITRQH